MTDAVHITWFPTASGTATQVPVPGDAPLSVLDVLHALDITPDTVLVVRDGRPIPVDATVSAGERLRIVRTVSGG